MVYHREGIFSAKLMSEGTKVGEDESRRSMSMLIRMSSVDLSRAVDDVSMRGRTYRVSIRDRVALQVGGWHGIEGGGEDDGGGQV